MVYIIVQPNHRVNTVNKIGVHYRPTQNVCAVVLGNLICFIVNYCC